MPWWKSSSSRANGAQSPSSESSSPQCSSSSPSQSSRRQRRDFGIAWSGRRDVHHQQPRLTRQRKLRHLTTLDVAGIGLDDGVAGVGNSGGGWEPLEPVTRSVSCLDLSPAVRSSGTMGSVLRPQPLPLPESAGCHMPSPQRALVRGAGEEANGSSESSSSPVEPNGERFSAATPVGSRFAHHNVYKGNEHVDVTSFGVNSGYSRKAFQDRSATQSVNFRVIAPPRSAPASGLSSPALSPRRLSTGDFFLSNSTTPGIPVMWSAPEFPSNEMAAGYSTQTSPEKMLASADHSPRYSPTVKSPGIRSRNPSSPPSPLHPKYPETSAAWHDGNGTINVHPLPLPPGGMVTIQSSFPLQTASKNEAATITSQWQKGKLIGSGTFGNVYIATNRHTGASCAMKEVNLIPDDPKTAECIKQLEQEIKVLSQLKHPNIVQYYGSEIIDDRFYIYLEYIFPGSINKYVREHCGAITESVVRNFTRHILKGLAFLHSTKTMHRDIKGANLLVDANGVVKLADFGMAKHLSGAKAALSLKGTPYWMAPEVVQATMNKDVGYDLSIDIWSLGCTIIEMFTGKHPWDGFEGAAAMFKVLRESPQIPDTLSAEGKDFLQHCFRRNPAERPSASQLLEHSFVRSTNHPDIHGTMHSFAGLKLAEASSSPSDGTKSKTDLSVKGKHGHSHYHGEKPELSPIRLSPRSTLEMVPGLSPPRTNQGTHCSPGPSSILDGVPWVGGKQHIPAFSRSCTNEASHPH